VSAHPTIAAAIQDRLTDLADQANTAPHSLLAADLANAAIASLGIRLCTHDDHPRCCTTSYVEQPDGIAVHRADLDRYHALTP
jgi:hypothetical protein